MKTFEVEVPCTGGGTPHSHLLVVERGPGMRGASRPTRVRLQYTCPETDEAFVAVFEPPVGAGRPFVIVQVT